MVTRLATEDELGGLFADQGVDETYLQNIVAGATPTTAPTTTPTTAPRNVLSLLPSDWSDTNVWG